MLALIFCDPHLLQKLFHSFSFVRIVLQKNRKKKTTWVRFIAIRLEWSLKFDSYKSWRNEVIAVLLKWKINFFSLFKYNLETFQILFILRIQRTRSLSRLITWNFWIYDILVLFCSLASVDFNWTILDLFLAKDKAFFRKNDQKRPLFFEKKCQIFFKITIND
jgi:hypothetical protein